jgi:hypothetical protein
MTHDPLCPTLLPFNTLEPYPCQCRLIAKVREDTLARCIEEVENAYHALLGLRFLQEKP